MVEENVMKVCDLGHRGMMGAEEAATANLL